MPPDGSLGSLLRTKPESDIHIGLRFRKKLFATFEASRHLHHNWKFPSEGALEAVAALFGGASISASDPRLLSDDKTRLDAHLQNVATKTNESARDVIVDGLPEEEAIRERLAQFVKAAANVDCAKCAGSLLPCCGQESDILRLSGEAQCWKFLRDVFDLSVLITNTRYDPIITINIQNHPVDLGFVTLPGADFSAQTGFRDKGRSHKRSVISIKLPFNRFNILTWLDLFQPLIHEVFVHAPQNFYLDGERRAHGEDCPFSEGYLDACAHKVLQTTLGSQGASRRKLRKS
jgi:hypothetical protein